MKDITNLLRHWNIKRRSKIELILCSFEWVMALYFFFYYKRIQFEINNQHIYVLLIDIVFYLCIFVILLKIYSMGTFDDAKLDYNIMYPFMKSLAFAIDISTISLPIWIASAGVLRIIILKVIGKELYLTIGHLIALSLLYFGIILFYFINAGKVMPYYYYEQIEKELVYKAGRYLEMWFSVSDKYRISSFSLLPLIEFLKQDYRESASIVFCGYDIETISTKNSIDISFSDFYRCLIYLSEESVSDNIALWLRRIGMFPHISVLFAFERKNIYMIYKDEIDELRKTNPVDLLFLPGPVYDILTLSNHLKKYTMKKGIQFVDPVRNIFWSELLRNIYSKLSVSPKLIRIMLRKVFYDLEPMAGLYAMFDMIDLINRLVFSFYAPENSEWYQVESNSRKIGNLFAMMTYIEDKQAGFLGEEIPKSMRTYTRFAGNRCVMVNQVFTDEGKKIIKRYLVNYDFPESGKMNYGDITFLCANLRNAIRGHGSILYEEIPSLQKLIFTLFLMDYHILEIDKMKFKYINHSDDIHIIGKYGKYKTNIIRYYDERSFQKIEKLDFILNLNDKLLFFNNCIKINDKGISTYRWEYVDYISGELINPSFRHIVSP